MQLEVSHFKAGRFKKSQLSKLCLLPFGRRGNMFYLVKVESESVHILLKRLVKMARYFCCPDLSRGACCPTKEQEQRLVLTPACEQVWETLAPGDRCTWEMWLLSLPSPWARAVPARVWLYELVARTFNLVWTTTRGHRRIQKCSHLISVGRAEHLQIKQKGGNCSFGDD